MKHLLLTISILMAGMAAHAQELVKDIDPGSESGFPNNFITFRNYSYFVASDGVHGFELWKTDGTDAGTVMVKDVNPTGDGLAEDEDGLVYSNFTIMNNELYFFANDGATGFELWKSDGTEGGTMLVKDIFPGDTGSVDLGGQIAVLGNNIYFSAQNADNNTQLWKSDGTPTGTVPLNVSNENGLAPDEFFVHDSLLFFVADSGFAGRTLWKTNGTDAGTVMIKDIDTVNYDAYASNFTVFNNQVFFNSYDVVHGSELWVTDGTPNGTHVAVDIAPGPFGSNPQYIIIFGNKMLLSAGNLADGNELWVSDGTPQGTTELKDINATSSEASSNPTELTAFGNRVFFQADDGVHGAELWVTDGTPAGTQLFKDLNTTTTTYPGSYPENFVVINDTMYFDADDSIHGRELWRCDGTPSGTMMLEDLYPGGNGSYPSMVAPLNDLGLYNANNSTIGFELYRVGTLVTGVEEIQASVDFAIQPNPARDYILVKADESFTGGKLQLLDLTGREILSETLESTTSTLNTASLPAGLYLVKLADKQGGEGVKKVVIE